MASPRILFRPSSKAPTLYHSSHRAFSCSSAKKETYGFIGLGQMGYRMAGNLRAKLPASDKLIIFDVNTKVLKNFVQQTGPGTSIGKDARHVAEQSSTIITVLPSDAIVTSIFDTILPSPLPPPPSNNTTAPTRLYIDCSTISPLTSRALASRISSTSTSTTHFLDAPMSGGTVGASAGTLTFMLGAPSSLVPRATTILQHMGKRVIHLGDQGSGLCGKLANNYLLALNNIATAEAMNLGMRLGLDPGTLAGMINSSTGKCWPSEINNPVPGVFENAPAGRGYDGGFGVALMKKDLGLAIDAAEAVGIDMGKGLGKRAREVYDACEGDEACRGKDFSVIYRWLGGKE